MRTRRTLPTIVLIAAAAISLAACVPVSEAVADRDLLCEAIAHDLCIRAVDLDRDLECGEMADDLCIRVADVAVSEMSEQFAAGRLLNSVVVKPAGCWRDGAAKTAKRCWKVDGAFVLTDAFQARVYELPDGTLGVDG